MISGEIYVNYFTLFRLVLGTKYGDDSLQVLNIFLKIS